MLQSKSQWLTGLLVTVIAGIVTLTQVTQAKTVLEVWKDPNCGCCHQWIKHVKAHGYAVKVHDTGNQQAQLTHHITPSMRSCHTATVNGYAIEGHVPAADIQRLLTDKPTAIGLSVPGMIIGTPGMDGPEYQGIKNPYQVLLMKKTGDYSIFSAY